VPRELFNASLGKVRSYAIDEKTAHWAAKFSDYRRGSNRVGETHSSIRCYYLGEPKEREKGTLHGTILLSIRMLKPTLVESSSASSIKL